MNQSKTYPCENNRSAPKQKTKNHINDLSNSTGQREIHTKNGNKYHSIVEEEEAATQGIIKTLSN